MSEFKAMKFWIGDDPELSEKVQKILFGLGYKWAFESRGVTEQVNAYSMYAESDGGIRVASHDKRDGKFSFPDDGETIDIDWMRTKKPETIELAGKTYIKSELEEALRHIKPV